MDDHLIKRLIATIKCGTCGKHYREDQVEIIEHEQDVWFLQVFCPGCQVRSLVAAVIQKEEKADTDLTGAEIARFRTIEVVSGDDVLDMRRFLKDFDGDFAGLFKEHES